MQASARAATLLVIVSFGVLPAYGADAEWRAGVAKVNITPKRFMWMSGYASRTKPAEGKLTDLWAKALALETPNGKQFVLVTLDLVGIPRDLSVPVCRRIKEKYGLPRAAIALSTSHTHTGPVVRSNLNTMYSLSPEQQRLVKEYGDALEDDIVKVVGMALGDLKPARLSWKIGRATFAVNRRNNPEREVPRLRKEGKLKGPVDHDVPVLAVRDRSGKLRAVVFGYACHATVLSFYKWSGDYPGFAQIYLEQRHPGAVAMFWAGCGGDQNPLPRRKVTLAMKYGKELADAVDFALSCKMALLKPTLVASYREIPLPFGPLPTREQLVKDSLSKNRYVAARARLLLTSLEKGGKLPKTYPYPVQVWKLGGENGGVTWVILGGEVVVDYALRIKRMLGAQRTWVMAYANDVMAYIPSVRVLKEGGYEGRSSMIYYGQPTVWSPRIEEMIVSEVRRQASAGAPAKQTRGGSPGR